MNKMVRNLVKVAAICATSVLVLASCSKHDINASRQMEERYARASAEIENSAPRTSSQSVIEEEVIAPASADATNPSVAPNAVTPAKASATQTATATKTAKKGFVMKAVEKTVTKKVERFVEKHPDLKQKYEGVNEIDHNLKMALILALVAIIISLFSGFSWIFGLVALIFLIIALIFLIMWILTL